jgi:general secretion pathway protein B
MSYILDALKKSEQERGRGTAPNVQTMHSSSLNYHSSKTQLWPYLLLAAILINLAALAYFIIARPETGTSAQNQQVISEARPVATSTANAVNHQRTSAPQLKNSQDETVIYKPVSMPGTSTATVKQASTAMAAPTVYQQPGGPILERDELPLDIRQHIPTMEFSAHVYSTNPLQRSIVINGRFMEEGDRLASDLVLDEITPDGAIFNFQGQRFRQGVVSAWN